MINIILIVTAIIIIFSVWLNNMSHKIGIPVLLAFIILGMFVGWNTDSIGPHNYWIVKDISTIALIIIMFYGGFGTRWGAAKPIIKESVLLATLGVIFTAGLTGLFCHYALRWEWLESFLMGSVVASTDAASVFSILRSRKLGLKNYTAPILEVESGSNDPCSYMLTIIMISIMQGAAAGTEIIWMIFAQIVFGVVCGALIAKAAIFALKRVVFLTSGFDSLFILGIAILAYAVPTAIGGNGFLSVYIVGIALGNAKFTRKKTQVHFFDGVTSLMQLCLFFMLGFMSNPASLYKAMLPALAIMLFMLFAGRPLSVLAILGWYKKYKRNQRVLISFVGLRGAASIVFAIIAVASNIQLENNILDVVFCIVLLSIAIQGSLIPKVAKKLDMTDENEDVLKTFSDYSETYDVQFSEFELTEKSTWNGKRVKEIGMPKSLLLAMILRDGNRISPRGNTQLRAGDKIILCSREYDGHAIGELKEKQIVAGNKYVGKTLDYWSKDGHELVVLIRRGDETIIPKGNTVLQADDYVVVIEK